MPGRGDHQGGPRAVGPDVLLMVDAGGSDAFWKQGFKWALRTSHMLAAFDVAWFEEPLKPDALQDYILLRQQSPVPIAGGEVLTRRQSFQPWLEAGALDVVQPDVTKVGGIERRAADCLDGPGARCTLYPSRMEHGGRRGGRFAIGLSVSRHRSGGDI